MVKFTSNILNVTNLIPSIYNMQIYDSNSLNLQDYTRFKSFFKWLSQ